MTENELRDRCCYKRCRQESDMIFMGAGLCDSHYALACSTVKTTYDFLLPRVIPAAARELQSTRRRNEAKEAS